MWGSIRGLLCGHYTGAPPEQEGIAIDEEEKLKDLALSGLYKRAGRSSLSMSAVEWTEEVADQPQARLYEVMDEVLYDKLAYPGRMDSPGTGLPIIQIQDGAVRYETFCFLAVC